MSNDQALPEKKVERTDNKEFKEKVTYQHPTKGKKTATMSGHTYSEREIEDIHLTKIAPMVFVSEESNNVLMVPFTIKYTPQEFADWLAKCSLQLYKHFGAGEEKTTDQMIEEAGKQENNKSEGQELDQKAE